MGVLASYKDAAVGYGVNLNVAHCFPLNENRCRAVFQRTKGAATYGVYFQVVECTTTESEYLGSLYVPTGFFDNFDYATVEQITKDDYIILITDSLSSSIGISGPAVAIEANYYPDLIQDTVIRQGISFDTDGLINKTKFTYPAYINGQRYYRWDVVPHESARTGEKEIVQFGTAADIEEATDDGNTNFWAVRYHLKGEEDANSDEEVILQVPTWWRYQNSWVQGGWTTVTITSDHWTPNTDVTINVTVKLEHSSRPVGLGTEYNISNQWGITTYGSSSGKISTQNETVVVPVRVFATGTIIDILFSNQEGSYLYSPYKHTIFSGAKTLDPVNQHTDCAVASWPEYIGPITYSGGVFGSSGSVFAKPVYDNGHLYSWIQDRTDQILLIDIDTGNELSMTVTPVANVPAMFNHEKTRISYVAGGMSIREYNNRRGINFLTTYDLTNSSFSVDVVDDAVYHARTWRGEAEPNRSHTIYNYTQSINAAYTIKSLWPKGHSNHEGIDLGVFVLRNPSTAPLDIVPWVYLDIAEPGIAPPLKMSQRDDGLGPYGGPGRINYYGRNGDNSNRIAGGGAW